MSKKQVQYSSLAGSVVCYASEQAHAMIEDHKTVGSRQFFTSA
jgi:hypothetical protein